MFMCEELKTGQVVMAGLGLPYDTIHLSYVSLPRHLGIEL